MKLENHLQNSFFRKISRPVTLKLNSPVLQRKEGYRQVLKAWLMFDLAAKLVWHGGDDVYKAGKRNVAKLYEYWLFFILLDLVSEIFNIEQKSINELIQETKNGLGLQLKEGQSIALEGVYNNDIRELNVRFSYNRVFNKTTYPNMGTWTLQMRPDYTLSIWPKTLTEDEAERLEEIVHIHFDAKYKVVNINKIIEKQSLSINLNHKNNTSYINHKENITEFKSINKNKEDEAKGIYKNIDLLKMHAYKDAIRRTSGAYVLYPGDKSENLEGFHEVLPGLGAFSIKPSRNNSGIKYLREFIEKVTHHFLNRASQRENLAIKSYNIHKNKLDSLKSKIPEGITPSETFVLVGYHKGDKHYNWIKDNGLYNVRTGKTRKGAVPLNSKILKAKYLLLYTKDEDESSDLWEVIEDAPQFYSKSDMESKNYPSPSGNYLCFNIKKVKNGFDNAIWDISELNNPNKNIKGAPFTVTLTELMKAKTQKQKK